MAADLRALTRRVISQLRNPWVLATEGLDRLPTSGVIVACNRVGAFDHLQVCASLGRSAVVLTEAGSGLASWPGIRRTTWLTDSGLDQPTAVLARGEALVVFPERHVGGDNAVHKGHPELVALALACDVPIVPAGLTGGTPSRLRFGEPIHMARYRQQPSLDDTLDSFLLRAVTETVMAQLVALTARDYVDEYARPADSRRPGPMPSLRQLGELRQLWLERRAEERQRLAEEAELARRLDEQEQLEFAAARAAAREQAEQAAQAAENARRQRRAAHQSCPSGAERP